MKGKPRSPQGREKKKKPSTASSKASTHPMVVDNPKYGRIPLVKVPWVNAAGQTVFSLDFDPGYRPSLPSGAIPGDIREQIYCPMCCVPRYYYVDEKRTCIQCGQEFVFLAREQKYWFEVLKFNYSSTAIRCVACRRKRRSDRSLRMQLQLASGICQETPDDPLAYLAYAEAVLNHFRRFGTGDLDKGIAACRKARRLSSRLNRKAQDLEDLLHEAAGHSRKPLEKKANGPMG